MKIKNRLPSIALALTTTTLLVCCLPAKSAEWTPTFRDGIGKNEPLCRALLQHIRDYSGHNSQDTRCSLGDIISSYPEFAAPPWQELDPKKHKELLVKLFEGEVGANPHMSELDKQKFDAKFIERADEFIKEGGRLRMLRTNPPLIHGKTFSAQEQVFMQKFIGPDQTSFCVDAMHPAWFGGTHIVTSDLNGRDPLYDFVKPGSVSKIMKDGAFLLYNSELYLYEGKYILVGEQDISRFSNGSLHQLCSFK